MFLGIDVGGTFTDGVAVVSGKIVSMVKTPTTHTNLLEGILVAVDKVVQDVGSTQFTRVALSTTIVTNALVEGKTDKVGLCIMSGPGMDITRELPVEPYVLSGYVDHRGQQVAAPVKEEVVAASRQFSECNVFAVSGKFAVRNPQSENIVAEWLREQANPSHITVGSGVAGTLNFLRRTNSAYYNAAVWRHFNMFASAVEEALKMRGIDAPVYVLKADGGTMPLAVARDYPVEAIFTGPAASVLGIMAMNTIEVPTISLDIGGTTTDIALWQNGVPLFAERGAKVGSYATAVRSFRLKSIGLGGDSFVWRDDTGKIKVGPMRYGPAMALGGTKPTVTDAMVVVGASDFGNYQLAIEAMSQVAFDGQSPREVADMVLRAAVNSIYQAIENMLAEQAAEPVYRVEDIVHGAGFVPRQIIGVGGGAVGLVPMVAKHMGLEYQLPSQGMVANAVGAAVARPTVDITMRADTAQGYYTVAELGIKNKLPSRGFSLADAHKLATQHLAERAQINGITFDSIEIIQSEEFNVIRGFQTVGKIITCRLQVKPGVLMHIKGEL